MHTATTTEATTGRRPPHPSSWRRNVSDCDEETWFLILFGLLLGALALVILWGAWDAIYRDELKKPPEYSVAIAGVSGLPASTADLQQGFDPEFRLTIGITSQTRLAGACIEPGTSVKVSYSHARIPLASGRAPDMCVGPLQSSDAQLAVARGFGVTVPGYLTNSLIGDMVRGEAVFEVTLKSLKDDYWTVVTCWARVPDPDSTTSTGDRFKAPCTRDLYHISNMPGPQPVDVRHPAVVLSDMSHATPVVAGSCPATLN